MVEQNQPAINPSDEQKEKDAAAGLLIATVKQLVGSAMGEFENTLKALGIAVNGQGDDIQRHSNELEALKPLLGDLTDGLMRLGEIMDETPVNVGDRSVRRRMNRSISTKGIIQYDGTVETHGFSRDEFEAEQAWMDQLQNRIQPTYKEFVEPILVSGFTMPDSAAEVLGITEEEAQAERIVKEDDRTT